MLDHALNHSTKPDLLREPSAGIELEIEGQTGHGIARRHVIEIVLGRVFGHRSVALFDSKVGRGSNAQQSVIALRAAQLARADNVREYKLVSDRSQHIQISGQIGSGGVVVQTQVTTSSRAQELERGQTLLLVHISAQGCHVDGNVLRRCVFGLSERVNIYEQRKGRQMRVL